MFCLRSILTVSFVAGLMAMPGLVAGETPAQPEASRIVKETFTAKDVRNIIVDVNSAQVFFTADNEHYVWSANPDAANVQSALFVIAEQLKKAPRIEIVRWEPDRRGITRDRILYLYVKLSFIYAEAD